MFAGRGAVDVGEDEHAVALVELPHQLLRLRQDRVGVVVHGDADLAHARGRLPSTWLAQWISASPKAPCATIRMPIIG